MADSVESLQQLIIVIGTVLSVIVFPTLALMWSIFKKRIQKALNLNEEQMLMIDKLIENGKLTDKWIQENNEKVGSVLRAIVTLSPAAKDKLDENQINIENWTKDTAFTRDQLKVIYDVLEGYAGQLKNSGEIKDPSIKQPLEITANKVMAARGMTPDRDAINP